MVAKRGQLIISTTKTIGGNRVVVLDEEHEATVDS
jgi:hypothetical protein